MTLPCRLTGIRRTGRFALEVPDARLATGGLSHLTISTMNAACTHEPPLGLADYERLGVTGAVGVGPHGGAVARRAARHRGDGGIPARGQGAQGGRLDRRAPRAVRLAIRGRPRMVRV